MPVRICGEAIHEYNRLIREKRVRELILTLFLYPLPKMTTAILNRSIASLIHKITRHSLLR